MQSTFLFGAAIAAAVLAFASLLRAVRGPTIYDRIIAVNVIATKTIIMILLLAFALNATYFIDVALVYSMCGFVGTIAILKGIRAGNLGRNSRP